MKGHKHVLRLSMPPLLSLLVIACLSLQRTIGLSTISNVAPRHDTSGSIVNAHDGCLVQFNGTYYLYGTVYENCTQSGPYCDGHCGYFPNTFSLYSSQDLVEWTLLSQSVLPKLEKDNDHISYWMPNVGYNDLTKQFVMVYWSGHYGFVDNQIAVAVSDSVQGPFTNIEPIKVKGGSVISSTVSLFVGPDNDGYVRYNTRDSPLRHVIEKLTPDWRRSEGSFSIIFEKSDYPWYEGGGSFYRKENNKYYTMLGSDCCFCEWGADAKVFIADESPMNEWRLQTPENETNFCSDGHVPDWSLATDLTINPCSPRHIDAPMNFTLPSQQFGVFTLQTNDGELFVYNGEHFKSSTDGLKSHDLQTWIPLEFGQNGSVLPMKWQNEWTVQLV